MLLKGDCFTSTKLTSPFIQICIVPGFQQARGPHDGGDDGRRRAQVDGPADPEHQSERHPAIEAEPRRLRLQQRERQKLVSESKSTPKFG